jgi:hypothetical protein
MRPDMAKRKKEPKPSPPTEESAEMPALSPTAAQQVQFSLYTTPEVVEAIDKFRAAYNADHPGVNIKRARAADILLRRVLRGLGYLGAQTDASTHD